jgi:hypothetical protein
VGQHDELLLDLGLNERTHPIWAGSWIGKGFDFCDQIGGRGKSEKIGKLLDRNGGHWS